MSSVILLSPCLHYTSLFLRLAFPSSFTVSILRSLILPPSRIPSIFFSYLSFYIYHFSSWYSLHISLLSLPTHIPHSSSFWHYLHLPLLSSLSLLIFLILPPSGILSIFLLSPSSFFLLLANSLSSPCLPLSCIYPSFLPFSSYLYFPFLLHPFNIFFYPSLSTQHTYIPFIYLSTSLLPSFHVYLFSKHVLHCLLSSLFFNSYPPFALLSLSVLLVNLLSFLPSLSTPSSLSSSVSLPFTLVLFPTVLMHEK